MPEACDCSTSSIGVYQDSVLYGEVSFIWSRFHHCVCVRVCETAVKQCSAPFSHVMYVHESVIRAEPLVKLELQKNMDMFLGPTKNVLNQSEMSFFGALEQNGTKEVVAPQGVHSESLYLI